MYLSDKVYYVECHFETDKNNVLETTVEEAINAFKYEVDDVLKDFEKKEDKSHFILNTGGVSSYLQNYIFWFDRNNAIKEMLNNLDNQISRVKSELSSLEDVRIKWIIEMS